MNKVFDSLSEVESNKTKSNIRFTLLIAILLAVALTVAVLFSTVFFFVRVEGQSMENTLHEGDGLIVNKCATVERGDIVIIEKVEEKLQRVFPVDGKIKLSDFEYPFVEVISATDDIGRSYTARVLGDYLIVDAKVTLVKYKCSYNVIKRVIGLGGDVVRIKDGKVSLKMSGSSDFIPLSEEYVKDADSTYSNTTEYVVQNEQVFYLGDNRIKSEDSRDKGCCKLQDVKGVVSSFAVKTKGFTSWIYKLFSPSTDNVA